MGDDYAGHATDVIGPLHLLAEAVNKRGAETQTQAVNALVSHVLLLEAMAERGIGSPTDTHYEIDSVSVQIAMEWGTPDIAVYSRGFDDGWQFKSESGWRGMPMDDYEDVVDWIERELKEAAE